MSTIAEHPVLPRDAYRHQVLQDGLNNQIRYENEHERILERRKYRFEAPRIFDMPLNPTLTQSELIEALVLRDYARGTMLIYAANEKAAVGSGKTTFVVWLGKKLYRMFFRPVIFDFWPTQKFIDLVDGNFTFIDEDIVLQQMKEIQKMTKINPKAMEGKDQWVMNGQTGTVLRNCSVFKDEADKNADSRRTSSNMNIAETDWFKRWRHFNILLGHATPFPADMDRKRALERYMLKVQCEGIREPPCYDDYCLLCLTQGLEPDDVEFMWWYIEQNELYLAGNSTPIWFQYRLTRTSHMTATGVVPDPYDVEPDTFTVFAPTIWPLFWTANPTTSRTSILRKKEL
jgi:hypothetical protein